MLINAANLPAKAQDDTDKKAITECLQNYLSREGDRVEKAFHPSASMKFISPAGQFTDVPIAVYINRVKENKTKTEERSEIVRIDIEGNAAQAKLRSETDKFILYDFMNLLKIDGEWKVVSKIFYRKDK